MSSTRKATFAWAAVLALSAPLAVNATFVTVTDFDAQPWERTLIAEEGTAEIVSLAGKGGNLETNAPLPTGAARLTTTDENASRAEVQYLPDGGFGTVEEIFTGDLSFSYSMFKGTTGDDFAAPTLKFQFFNAEPELGQGGFTQLIFEPNWNIPGTEGDSTAVTSGEWLDFTVSLDTGLLWTTGGFGQGNSFGGPPLRTLGEWQTTFNADFGGANLFGISVGLGTFNPDQIGYFDNVQARAGALDVTFDFEAAAAVPTPATLPLLAVGLLALAGMARRRQAQQAAHQSSD